MNDKQRATMRNSFKRMAGVSQPVFNARLSEDDIKILAVMGFTDPTVEPYRPVSSDEARGLLEEVASTYSRSKVDNYLEDAQNRVMEAIIRPFGLAKVLFEDKDGGNVTTIHNAQQKIYSRKEDKYAAGDYRTSKFKNVAKEIVEDNTVDDGIHFMEQPHDYFEESLDDYTTDAYNGNDIHPNIADVDHVIAAEKFHRDGGYMLSKERRRDFGADRGNLAITNRSGNRSMGSTAKHDWQPKKATDGSGRTNKEVHGQDNRMVNPAVKRGEETARKHLPNEMEKAVYYTKGIAFSGADEARKMGLQQAMGAFLLELSRGMWDEIRDSLAVGIRTDNDQSLMRAIVERLKRVGNRVLSKWKDIVVAFKDGAISGFLSNLITVVINMFLTTAKNAVRMIREGFMSLVRGFKYILSPPEGYTKAEAFHEGGKIVIAGIAVSLGICAEESVKNSIALIPVLGPLIKPFADSIAPVLVGIAVGLGTSFLCYLWDKLDLFGAEEDRRHKFIMDTLERQRSASATAADAAVAENDRHIQDCDQMIIDIEQIDREFWELANA